MNYEDRQRKLLIREQGIRRTLLSMLVEERTNGFDGWVTARYVFDVLQGGLSQNMAPDDDDHIHGLLCDLVSGGYAEDRDDRDWKSQDFRLDTWSVRYTNKGVSLIKLAIDPDPLIADPRPRPRN